MNSTIKFFSDSPHPSKLKIWCEGIEEGRKMLHLPLVKHLPCALRHVLYFPLHRSYLIFPTVL